jgi:hypothetical protein
VGGKGEEVEETEGSRGESRLPKRYLEREHQNLIQRQQSTSREEFQETKTEVWYTKTRQREVISERYKQRTLVHDDEGLGIPKFNADRIGKS